MQRIHSSRYIHLIIILFILILFYIEKWLAMFLLIGTPVAFLIGFIARILIDNNRKRRDSSQE